MAFSKKQWSTGDIITATELNRIENGISNSDTNKADKSYVDDTFVKTINGSTPDENGNVEITASGGGELSSSEPITGVYNVPQQVLNSSPVAGGYLGWVCIKTGTANKTQWTTATPYTANTMVYFEGNVYRCVTGGTSGEIAPTGEGTSISDGGCTWSYVGPKAVFKTFGPISI